ncbi:hypothetical protein BC831DRAFT_449008 [Entophlyctis helioformis]|nr:hypothetical protein BC831DRAFT_449008 [Entophlyctis helioformis]
MSESRMRLENTSESRILKAARMVVYAMYGSVLVANSAVEATWIIMTRPMQPMAMLKNSGLQALVSRGLQVCRASASRRYNSRAMSRPQSTLVSRSMARYATSAASSSRNAAAAAADAPASMARVSAGNVTTKTTTSAQTSSDWMPTVVCRMPSVPGQSVATRMDVNHSSRLRVPKSVAHPTVYAASAMAGLSVYRAARAMVVAETSQQTEASSGILE